MKFQRSPDAASGGKNPVALINHAENLNKQGLKLAEDLKPYSTQAQYDEAVTIINRLGALAKEIAAANSGKGA